LVFCGLDRALVKLWCPVDGVDVFVDLSSLVVVVEIGVPPMIGLILAVLSLDVVMSILLVLHTFAEVQSMQGVTLN
jgi:hypothetical protein